MTNNSYSLVDGNHTRIASDFTSRLTRPGSLSIVSRQSVLGLLLLVLTLFMGVGQMWGADETLTITGASTGHNAPWGTQYSSNSGSSTTSASNSIGITWSNVGRMNTGIQIKNASGAGFYSTSYPSTNNIIKSIKITGKTNTSNIVLSCSTNGTSWTTKSFTSGTALDVSASKYKYFKVTQQTAYCVLTSIVVTYTAPASCDKKVTITAGTPESGASFSLNKTGEQDCCSALTVTVSSITAPSGKQFSAITQSGINSGVTIDQENKTVTYAANSTGSSTINVTFVDLPKYTVTLKDDNDTRTQASYGAAVTLPERAGCTGYTFAGWTKTWTSAQASWTTDKPEIIEAGSYTPTGDENLYPVYTKEEEGGTEEHETIFDWTPSNSPLSSEQDGITATFAKGNGGNSPQYNSTGTAIRLYYKNTLTFEAEDGITLKTIVFTTASSNGTFLSTVSVTSGFFSTKTWSGINASSGTLTNSTTASSGHTRVQKATVTYETSGGTTTYYISEPNCCTALGQINGTFFLTHFLTHFWVRFLESVFC